MIKAVIIEDELNSRILLEQLLEDYCENIAVVATANNVSSGVEVIKQNQPNLIFLDIDMPGGNGFDILRAFNPILFNTIFVTGHDKYAIKAFKYSALDYLLKPVNVIELQNAVKKAHQFSTLDNLQLSNLEWNLKQPKNGNNQMVVFSGQEYILFHLKEILYLEALGSYVNFVLQGNKKYLSTYSLSHYEEILPVDQFFRTHKSYIVNCKKVVSVSTGRGGVIYLQEGQSVPIAIRRKASFVQLMGLKG